MLHKRIGKRPIVELKARQKREIPIWLAGAIATVILLFADVGYHQLAAKLEVVSSTPIELPFPLKLLPVQIGGWTGEDIPISETIQRVTGCDDYLNRLYVHRVNNRWVNVYIAYSARPRTMVGHKPEVCYIAGGWILDSSEQSQVLSKSGLTVPCLVNRFHKPSPSNEEIVVVNFYVVNGQLTNDSRVFSGLGWRTPNIAGNPARYVAQVQVSSVLENTARTAVAEMIDLMLGFLPDEEGKTKLTRDTEAAGGILE
jgi:EpsI family protein